MSEEASFEVLVDRHYAALYRFAYSLARNETEAADLTQETFLIWAKQGHRLNDPTKAKTWLFTTLHREHLRKQRRVVRFPHHELTDDSIELPDIPANAVFQIDLAALLRAVGELDEDFRAAVVLFYLKDLSYQEIADVLGVPLGTVKSRIARGIARLHKMLASVPGPVRGGRSP